MIVAVGDPAPDFCLPGTGGKEYALKDYRGHSVLLAFYPGDNSPVCTVQLNEYSREISEFEDLDAQVLALSPQGVDSHEKFSEKQGGFAFPLLADTDKEVGRAYGILGPLGFYRRSVFVIDANGIIRYAHRSATGLTFKKSTELLEALQASKGM
jgi:thioredoxin-dependent peroxiredoxin